MADQREVRRIGEIRTGEEWVDGLRPDGSIYEYHLVSGCLDAVSLVPSGATVGLQHEGRTYVQALCVWREPLKTLDMWCHY